MLCNEVDRQDGSKKVGGPGKNLRIERKALTVTVQGKDAFPDAPSEAAIKDTESRCKNPEPHKLLEDLFNERPMWTRVGITFKTGIDENLLKILLAKYAFYILSGPWGRLWCRFGYDPRNDPTARQYQTVMVSFRQHQSIPERQRLKVSMSERAAASNQLLKVSQLISYVYQPGHLPPVRQMWYCVCDIQLQSAQNALGSLNVLKQCDDVSGWFPVEVINSIRAAIKEDVRRTSQQLELEVEEEGEEMMEVDLNATTESDDWD